MTFECPQFIIVVRDAVGEKSENALRQGEGQRYISGSRGDFITLAFHIKCMAPSADHQITLSSETSRSFLAIAQYQ